MRLIATVHDPGVIRRILAHLGLSRWIPTLVFGGAVLAFAWARWLADAWTWTIDDAAITAVYARNAAAGHGIVVHPGAMPTEGFSNPLLFLFSVLLAAVGLLHPLRSHLPLEALEFGALGVLVYLVLLRAAGGDRVRAVGATVLFLAYEILTPANLIWYGSGLENLQLTLGLVALLVRLEAWFREGPSPWLDGPLALAVAIVRPESLLYPAALLGVALTARLARGRAGVPPGFDRRLFGTVGICVVGGAVLLAARYLYFGDLLPNTYYAKLARNPGGTSATGYLGSYVQQQLISYGGTSFFLGGALAGALLTVAKLPWVGMLVCMAVALVLPASFGADWMGQHRFATAFFAMAHLGFCLLLASPPRRRESRRGDLAVRVALGLLPLVLTSGNWDEYRRFIATPHATVDGAADGEGFERLEVQARLGLWNPVVGLPDAGGANWVGRMQYVDTLALTDYHVARGHASPAINARYQAYERRLDMIEWHGVGAVDVRRFGTDMILAAGGNPPDRMFGFWVRRDLVESARIDVGARRLGEVDGLVVYLSPRTVPVALARSVVRIELLLEMPATALPRDTRVRVNGGGDTDDLFLLTALPGPKPLAAMPTSGVFRQGLLLHTPEQTGPLTVTVDIAIPGRPAARFEGGTVDVIAPEMLDDVQIAHVLAAAPDVVSAGARLAAVSMQASPRLPHAARDALLARLRWARDAQRSAVATAFDQLYADATAAPAPRVRARLDAARARLIASADAELTARYAATASTRGPAAALEEAGRFVDALRRVDLGDVVRAPGARRLLADARKRWLGKSPSVDTYPAFLGLTLFDQSQVRAQKKLFAARVLVAGGQ